MSKVAWYCSAGLPTNALRPLLTQPSCTIGGMLVTALHPLLTQPACSTGLWTTALQPLLAWAAAVVPRSQWSNTPVFLFGTAGLRVLNPESQTKLLGDVRRSLKASVFRQASRQC